MMLTIDAIHRGLGHAAGLPPEWAPDRQVGEATVDSRAVAEGGLFVALRGERTDGHLFLGEALLRGAIVALAEARAFDIVGHAAFVLPDGTLRLPTPPASGSDATPPPVVFVVRDSLRALQELAAWWRNRMIAAAIAITGSVGKTTTKETVANVIDRRFHTLRSRGNLNSESGLPLELLRLRKEHERMVLEMGMYGLGEIARLCELARPRIGVVTNVGPVHLERLGTIENIAMAKAELPRALPAASDGGVAVLNADDPRVLAMSEMTQARVFTYGLHPDADLRADDISSSGLEGIRFRLRYGDESFHVRLPMLGRHSVHTALRGAAVGLAEGMAWADILAGLGDVRGQLRLMVAPGAHDTTLIDDTYNASPDSMLAALNLLEEISNSAHRPIAVLGDMFELGSYEETGHRLVGARVAEVAKVLVAVGQRARWFTEEALAAGMPAEDVHRVETNEEAVLLLLAIMQPGDVVLVKGSRSAAMETIVDRLAAASNSGGKTA
jgi:UDP-N-acetylmuramoyl-tripeptide--D-alanyl-D-alanine ligase